MKPKAFIYFLVLGLLGLKVHSQDYCCPNRPEVETAGYFGLTDSTIYLTGHLLSYSNQESLKINFIVGTSPDALIDTVGVNTSRAVFKAAYSGFDLGRTYYYRAIASNNFGTRRGRMKSFDTPYKVYDIDSNEYNARWIGDQVWLTSNLVTTRYQNGDTIPRVDSQLFWPSITGVRAYYNFDSLNYFSRGILYSGHNRNDSRGICPIGWHVPSKSEWDTLIDFAGGTDSAGIALKSITGWDLYNGSDYYGTDLFKFNAKPSGQITDQGAFGQLNNHAFYWTASNTSSGDAYYVQFDTGWDALLLIRSRIRYGYCIRCIRD